MTSRQTPEVAAAVADGTDRGADHFRLDGGVDSAVLGGGAQEANGERDSSMAKPMKSAAVLSVSLAAGAGTAEGPASPR